MVCRVFQKSSTVKKPQQPTSSQQSLEYPCDTNTIVNELRDIELPNLNNIANSSSGISNMSLQNYNNDGINMNLNMNWAAAREAASTLPSLSWPSTLLNPNLSMNSLLLRALQLRTYQPREATSTDYSIMPQGIPHFGTDLASSFPASSSRVLDSVQQQQQEQPFNLDSIW